MGSWWRFNNEFHPHILYSMYRQHVCTVCVYCVHMHTQTHLPTGNKILNYWVMVTNLQTVCRMLNRVPTLDSVQSSIFNLFLYILT